MGRYQLSRKDAKINGRYHAQLARKTEAEKIDKLKQLKTQKHAKESKPSPPDS